MDEIKKVARIRKTRTLSAEAKIKQLDKKIAKLRTQLEEAEAEKAGLLKPIKMKEAVQEALNNMSTEEIAAKLGIEIE